MRVKARRMLLLILFIAGSQAAYPQNSFPENLQSSNFYWDEMIPFPEATQQEELSSQWGPLSNQNLSSAELTYLENVLKINRYHLSSLQKEERQFLFKYQHLAIYLSGMNPIAHEKFDREGIWMLTYPDARRYGLVVNDQIDERRDMAKSTKAARALFKDLKKRHGGDTEVMFVLGAAGRKHTASEKIVEVEENLNALRFLAKNFESEKIIALDTDWIQQVFDGEISIDVLTTELELADNKFRKMNPTLVGSRIPGGTIILLPGSVDGHRLISETKAMEVVHKRKLDSIVNRIKRNIPSPQSHKVITYRVKSGDVLGRIAEHYGVRVSKLKKWNNLRSDRIDINQKLTIYYPKGKKPPKKKVAKKTPKPEVKLAASEIGKFTIYEVQPGDTLWAICKKFTDVKPEDIMAWNAIGEKLSIGQKLKIKTVN